VVCTLIANNTKVRFHLVESDGEGEDWIRITMSLSSSLCKWWRTAIGFNSCFLTWKRDEALSVAISVWPFYCTATSTAASSALLMVSVGPLPPGLIVMVSLLPMSVAGYVFRDFGFTL
jgi:hypothetical protein